MLTALRRNATTTPRVRQEIQKSPAPAASLARRYGVSPATARKWKKREGVEDHSHRPNRLQTRLSPAQEAVAVELRRTLLLSLDDLLGVMRAFVEPELSRSALDRCLRRHGVGNLKALLPKEEPPAQGKGFKAYEPGSLHIDVKDLLKLEGQASR